MTGTAHHLEILTRTRLRPVASRVTYTAAFAAGVMARYRRVARRVEQLTFLLAQPKAKWVLVQQPAKRTTQSVEVMRTRETTSPPAVPVAVVHLRETHTLVVRTAAVPKVRIASSSGHAAALEPVTPLQRMSARRVRNEAVAAEALPDVARPLPAAAPAAPEMVAACRAPRPAEMPTVRTRPHAPAVSALEPQPEPALAARAESPIRTSGTKASLPPQEVERIAEQVLGSIDRRLVAERERQGRF